jgi:hypothetical protein
VDEVMKKAAYFGCIATHPVLYAKEYATMAHPTDPSLTFPSTSAAPIDDPLTDILRQGAQRMLTQAVEAEVEAWIDDHAHLTDAHGHRQIVRNGHAAPRTVVTGVGPVDVTMPRAHDRRPTDQRERFTSKILPPYLRKAKSIEELIPLALPQRHQHRRLHRSATGVARVRLPGSVVDHDHAADRHVAG